MTSADLKSALSSAGLSRRQLAEVLGVHLITVHKWASGERPVPRYVGAYLEAIRELKEDSATSVPQFPRRTS